MEIKYYSIIPVSFGMYETKFPSQHIPDSEVFFDEIEGEVYRLGIDILPEGIVDIRGKVFKEPYAIFVNVHNNVATYFGVEDA